MYRIMQSVVILGTVVCSLVANQSPKLDGSMVIPIFLDEGRYKVLLSIENAEGNVFNGKAEGFGGRCDPGETHALDTAAREFWEEGVLEKVLGWSLEQTRAYLGNNEHMRAAVKINDWLRRFPSTYEMGHDTIYYYIVYIEKEQADRFIAHFFDAIQEYAASPTEENFKFREKGDLVIVDWSDFVDAVRNPNLPEGSRVKALVYDMNSREKIWKDVDLRAPMIGAFYKHFIQHEDPLTGSNVFDYTYTEYAS